MKTKNLAFLPILLSLGLMLGISACSSTDDDGAAYGRWDEDSSAELDEREFGNAWAEEDYFRRWDVNNDSFLDDEEWNANLSKQLKDYDGTLQEWDTDADSRLSEEEFRFGVYSYLDRDGNRMINEEEYNLWYTPGTEFD